MDSLTSTTQKSSLQLWLAPPPPPPGRPQDLWCDEQCSGKKKMFWPLVSVVWLSRPEWVVWLPPVAVWPQLQLSHWDTHHRSQSTNSFPTVQCFLHSSHPIISSPSVPIIEINHYPAQYTDSGLLKTDTSQGVVQILSTTWQLSPGLFPTPSSPAISTHNVPYVSQSFPGDSLSTFNQISKNQWNNGSKARFVFCVSYSM